MRLRSRSSRPLARLASVGALGALALAGLPSTGAFSTGAVLTSSGTTTGVIGTRAACSAGTGFPAAVQALGPTFYYRFGEAAGAPTVADSSGNNTDGVVRQSSPVPATAGPVTFAAAGSGLIWCDTTDGMTSPSMPAGLGSGSALRVGVRGRESARHREAVDVARGSASPA